MTSRTHLLAAALVMAGTCSRAPSLSVPLFDVAVAVRASGTIEIRETITVHFAQPSITRFERHVPLERADSISFEAASIDGAPLEPGQEGPTSLDIEQGPGLKATWTFPPASDSTKVFQIAYRAHAAVAVRGDRGTIRLTTIPSERRYDIEAASLVFSADPPLHLFEGTGIAEAGWTVSRIGDGIAAERKGLKPGEGATVMAEVGIDRAVIAEPAWQRYEDWGRDLIPAFISGGLFILVIGAGVLWIVRFQHPKRRASVVDDAQERAAVRSGLRTTGLVAVVLSVVLAGVTSLTLSHFGWWPMSLPVSILVVGVVFLAVARRVV